MCFRAEIPVVLTMISLPGSRWRQHNSGADDLRMWNNYKYQVQAAKFWQDLARELKDHPAIVGYNILNEPHPEKLFDNSLDEPLDQVNQKQVQKMLCSFYELIIDAIRQVDKATPIILDSSAHADAKTFIRLKTHRDPNVLYSFHMYAPYEYTNHKSNQGRFGYPGKVHNKYWDKAALKEYMENVVTFQMCNDIPSNRILVGEFGGHRSSKGLERYFQDLVDIFTDNKWHFAFYAFREDTWDGMDYELGDKKLPWTYWEAIKNGKIPQLQRSPNTNQFQVLRQSYQ